MTMIQHVYFDVGGVLLLDYSGTNKWLEMKRALGVTEEHDEAFDHIWKKYRDRICIDCDVDDIVLEFELALKMKLPENYSMLDDFVNRFEINPSIWPVAQAAQEKYSVGLLTNMYPRMLAKIKAKQLIPDLPWQAVVDSSVVGYQKPDPGIYAAAEELAGVDPTTIFFIDNSHEHIAAAQQRGWQTLLYNPQQPEESTQAVRAHLGV